MALTGKFQLLRNEKFLEHIIALGVPEERAKEINALRPILEISIDGKKLTLTSVGQNFNHSTSLVFDEDIEETIALGIIVKSLATKSDNKIEIFSKAATGQSGTRVFEFFEDQMIMRLLSSTEGVEEAKRYYRRL